jgi:hypothetical protein
MRSPDDLFTVHQEVRFDDPPILLYAFSGFVDAGGGVRLAADHILEQCQHSLVATFDADELLDYRARRPRMTYVIDHFASVDVPEIVLHDVTDEAGQHFLLLTGPEPDYQWLRFLAAVDRIVERFGVRMAVGMTAIPWPIPHTRPLGVTVHGSEPELLAGHVSVLGEIEVPGHVAAMLELHLGQQGTPSMGITAQVPHYLVQFEFPRAAATLLEAVTRATGLVFAVADLAAAVQRADAEVTQQLEGNDEFANVVAALEQQYDQMATLADGPAAGLSDMASERMPTGEEIAAQVEQFLSSLDDPDDPDKQTGI